MSKQTRYHLNALFLLVLLGAVLAAASAVLSGLAIVASVSALVVRNVAPLSRAKSRSRWLPTRRGGVPGLTRWVPIG